MWIFTFVGVVTVIGFIIYLGLCMLYLMYKRDVKPYVSPDMMPILRPLPISTKNRGFGMDILAWLFDMRKWQLVGNWEFKIKDGPIVVVPDGHVFNGASILRPFWALQSPVGVFLIPALIHDYGYRYNMLWQKNDNGELSKFQSNAGKHYWDSLFHKIARDINGIVLINLISSLAVVIGGNFTWNDYREKKEEPTKPEI